MAVSGIKTLLFEGLPIFFPPPPSSASSPYNHRRNPRYSIYRIIEGEKAASR
jgi:hypothetical protein